MANKLTATEKEELKELLDHAGYPAAMKELELCVLDQERAVQIYNLETGDKEKLAFMKCRAEGARKAFVAFRARLQALKNSKK